MDPDLLDLSHALADTLNAYESHRLVRHRDPMRGIDLPAHDDMRRCSDESLHNPWADVVLRWPNVDRRASARTGLKSGSQVVILARAGHEVMVRYIATDHRWVVDPVHQSPAEAAAS